MGRWRYRIEYVDIPPEGIEMDRKITLFARPGELMGDPANHILMCLTEEEILAPAASRSKPAAGKDPQRAGGSPPDADRPG